MTEERLSLLQKYILTSILANQRISKSDEIDYKMLKNITWKILPKNEPPKELLETKSEENFHKLMFYMYQQTRNYDVSFSRAIRNLSRKHFIEIYTTTDIEKPHKKVNVSKIKINNPEKTEQLLKTKK